MDHPAHAVLPMVLVGVIVLAGAYCLARVLVPRLRPTAHGVGVDLGHVVMSGAMVAMLLQVPATVSVVLATGLVGAALLMVARGWRHRHAAYARGALAAVATALMLLPVGAAHASAPHAAMAPAHHQMSGMTTATAGPGSGTLLLLVLVALVGAWSVLVLLRRGQPLADRVGAACEVVLALAMAAMVVVAL